MRYVGARECDNARHSREPAASTACAVASPLPSALAGRSLSPPVACAHPATLLCVAPPIDRAPERAQPHRVRFEPVLPLAARDPPPCINISFCQPADGNPHPPQPTHIRGRTGRVAATPDAWRRERRRCTHSTRSAPLLGAHKARSASPHVQAVHASLCSGCAAVSISRRRETDRPLLRPRP